MQHQGMIPADGQVRCGVCGKEGWRHHDGDDILVMAKRYRFDYVMVCSGMNPVYRWECPECRNFAEAMVKKWFTAKPDFLLSQAYSIIDRLCNYAKVNSLLCAEVEKWKEEARKAGIKC